MPALQLESDYQPAYDAWQLDPSKTNTATMLKTIDPVLNSAVRAYTGPSASSPTLKSHARRLAVDALGSYDPQRSTLKTHMMSRLQRLRRIAAKQRQVISMPEQVAMDQMHMARAVKELEDKLQRAPSDDDLANYTGLSQKRIRYIRTGVRPISMGALTRTTEEGRGGFAPAVTSLGQEEDPWAETVYSDLESTNQLIMERALGMHGHPPQRPGELAKMLGISPAAVSHRMLQIQQKLDRKEELGGI